MKAKKQTNKELQSTNEELRYLAVSQDIKDENIFITEQKNHTKRQLC